MWCKQEDLEQYSRKNSLELHLLIPRGAYSSTEKAMLKVTNAVNVIVGPEDIEISHHIRLKQSVAIIVKFVSHKVNKLNTKRRNSELLSVWTMDGKVLSTRLRKARQ